VLDVMAQKIETLNGRKNFARSINLSSSEKYSVIATNEIVIQTRTESRLISDDVMKFGG